MNDMKRLPKYFFLGFIFHLFISLMTFGSESLGAYFVLEAIAAAVVLAVGLIKGGRCGVAFGASYLLGSLIGAIIFLYRYSGRYYDYHYDYYYYFLGSYTAIALQTFILVDYGYLPANFYWREKTAKALTTGFFIAFFADIVTSPFQLFYYAATPAIIKLILGGLSVLLCFRHMKPVFAPSYSKPISVTCASCGTVNSPDVKFCRQCGTSMRSVRCPNCGHSNPQDFLHCGKCGMPLERGETQVYG